MAENSERFPLIVIHYNDQADILTFALRNLGKSDTLTGFPPFFVVAVLLFQVQPCTSKVAKVAKGRWHET